MQLHVEKLIEPLVGPPARSPVESTDGTTAIKLSAVLLREYEVECRVPNEVLAEGTAAVIDWTRKNNFLQLGNGKTIRVEVVHLDAES